MGEKKFFHYNLMVLTNNKIFQKRCVKTLDRPVWFPGNLPPAHLDGTMTGDYGFDPLNLGSDSEMLEWFREAELQHSRWAMLGVAGILVGEVVRPEINFYSAPKQLEGTLPISIPNLLAIEFILMHFVEVQRWMDKTKRFHKQGRKCRRFNI